jgi:hypothetical protein
MVRPWCASWPGSTPRTPGSFDEIARPQLEQCRRDTGEALQMPLRALSFDTISGGGPNAAIIHYRVNTQHQPPHRIPAKCC